MSSKHFTRTASFTRPADTTQYTAGDGVSDNATTATAATFVFNGTGTHGKIHSVTLHKTDQDLTGADFDVYFFSAAVAGAGFEDNAAIAITDAEWQTCQGFVALVGSTDARSVVTGDLYCKSNLDLPYTSSSESALHFVVVARGTYTPASGEVVTVTLGIEVN